jgi:hypothetical protein
VLNYIAEGVPFDFVPRCDEHQFVSSLAGITTMRRHKLVAIAQPSSTAAIDGEIQQAFADESYSY